MAENTFNPNDWMPAKPAPVPTSSSSAPVAGDLADDIELVTQRIEAAHTDITTGYDNWLELGFALSDALGESGRDYFHRISRFNEGYDQAECDRQYDKCMRSHGTGVTAKTFFQKAKDAGISVSTRPISAKSATYAKSAHSQSADSATPISAQNQNADIADTAEIADMEEEPLMPTFSQQVKDALPEFLQKIVAVSNSEYDADILLLGSLTVLSACMPHICGVYDKRIVYPNLFLFVAARASSGKGRLTLCRYLVEPIHERLREINEAEVMEYKQKMAEYNAAGKKKATMEKPEEPPLRMLFIPANSSATAVYQVLSDNGGEGLMFETEGDTLANTFGSDYGNYSDGFRKAFHHETISYIRRKDREYVNIKHPKLSTLLTGTPRQILNLITDAENGLFSRFVFYYLNTRLIWNNVFDNSMDTTLDEYFQKLGADYQDLFKILQGLDHDLKFRFTIEQEEDFNATFDAFQADYVEENGEEFVASVRRLGVIMFRIAMCLSVLRLIEDGAFEDDITCLDIDYQTAKTIAGVLIRHNAKVFGTLPSSPQPIANTKGGRKRLKEQFFESLPAEFDRKAYSQLAEQLGLNPKSIDRTIRRWCDEGRLENIAHGKYQKVQ